MSASRRPLTRRGDYTSEERKFLLNGICLHKFSTRFGHPIQHPPGLNRGEIEKAWRLLSAELLVQWESPEFDYYRRRDVRPWACRYLEGETDA
jgi:hypothetical protein